MMQRICYRIRPGLAALTVLAAWMVQGHIIAQIVKPVMIGANAMKRRTLSGAGVVGIAAGAAGLVEWRRMGTMATYDATVAAERAPVAHQPELVALVRQAILAPSGHNTQPWRFRIGERRIDILPDLSRRTPVVDPDDHHLFVSLGCAAETLAIAAAAHGKPGLLVDAPES